MRKSAAVFCHMLPTKTLLALVFVVTLLTIPLCQLSVGQSAGNDTHLYFFTSQGCAPCEVVKPSLAKLDAAGYPVTIVDIRERPDWADHFRVDRTPTVIMVRSQQIIGRHAGVIGHSELLQWFTTAGYVPSPRTNSAGPVGTKVVINDVDSTKTGQPTPLQGTANKAFQSATLHEGTSKPANRVEEDALAATVKIKVEDDEGISYATGTVIHSHGSESLVVTCGHVFRDSQGNGKISGEYGFGNGTSSNARGDLIFYDAEARDIALLVLHTNGTSIPAVEIASKQTTVNKGENAFSIGCDHGENPTIRHTQIKNKAAYDGAIKYDIYGRPVNGRSGGGLFTEDGHLVGVCNAAVVDVDEGIYTALDTIHWQLEHTNLAHLFQPKTEPTTPASSAIASTTLPPATATPKIAEARPAPEYPRSVPRPSGRSSLVSLRGGAKTGSSINGDSEVLIIVRSKDNPGSPKMITLPNPSHRLIDYLENMPPVKSEVRQLSVADYREAKASSDRFRQRVTGTELR